MLVAEATVKTERSSRYLVQLCRHIDQVAQVSPHMRAQVEWSDDRGLIDFGWGRCTLRADPSVLAVLVEAPDEERLNQLQQRVTERLEQIGKRDHLAVAWAPPQGADDPLAGKPADDSGTRGHPHD